MEIAHYAVSAPLHLPYVQALQADAAFHKAIGLYVLAGLALSRAIGQPHKFPVSGVALAFGASFLVILGLLTLIWVALCVRPGASARDSFAEVFGPTRLMNLTLFCALFTYVQAFGFVKSMLPDLVPFYADPFLMKLDTAVLGQNAWRAVEHIVPRWTLSDLEEFYFAGWTAAGMASLLTVVTTEKLRSVRTQYVWTFLLAWAVLGNLVAAAGMSGGPVLYDAITGDLTPFAHLRAYLAPVAVHTHAREILLAAYEGKLDGSGIAVSAFPSMHLSMATLVVLAARRAGRLAFAGSLVFLAVILVGSVQFGWHYAVDGYFSIAATVLIWKLVGRAMSRRQDSICRQAPVASTAPQRTASSLRAGRLFPRASWSADADDERARGVSAGREATND